MHFIDRQKNKAFNDEMWWAGDQFPLWIIYIAVSSLQSFLGRTSLQILKVRKKDKWKKKER